jgi:hypothetical protein
LRPEPDCRPRRTFLHLSYSCASPFGPAILVTHDPELTYAGSKSRTAVSGWQLQHRLSPPAGATRFGMGLVAALNQPGATPLRPATLVTQDPKRTLRGIVPNLDNDDPRRLNTPPSAPRTTALPIMPAVLLPVDFANSVATWVATRAATVRATLRATACEW